MYTDPLKLCSLDNAMQPLETESNKNRGTIDSQHEKYFHKSSSQEKDYQ